MIRMQLTSFTDYGLRSLMYLAACPDRLSSVKEISGYYGISRNHLVKVVHGLGRGGYLETRRGIGGGFTLARPPEEICVGDVVRMGEEAETVVECADRAGRGCRIFPVCRLRRALDEAAAAFFAVLDDYSLADLLGRPSRMRATLGI